MTLVIGLIGRIASGKGEAAKYLSEKYYAKTFRFSDILKDILETLGIEDTRKNLQLLGETLRKSFGENILVDAMRSKILRSDSKIIVIDGIRYASEAKIVRSSKPNLLLFVDAPLEVRYERAVLRSTRGESDISLDDFRKSDFSGTEAMFDELVGLTDVVIDNVGDIEEFQVKVDESVRSLIA